jgi:glycine/D-amino acid oxidase-like deaminating enzyme
LTAALLMALRNKARALGVRFVQAEASGWQVQNGKVIAVTLRDGQSLPCDVAVNAAGAWSARLHDPSGFVLPVEGAAVPCLCCPVPPARLTARC